MVLFFGLVFFVALLLWKIFCRRPWVDDYFKVIKEALQIILRKYHPRFERYLMILVLNSRAYVVSCYVITSVVYQLKIFLKRLGLVEQ